MKLPFFSIFILLLPSFSVVVSNCYGDLDDTGVLFKEAFQAIEKAEKAGGNVSDLVEHVNRAINLIRSGNIEDHDEAEALLESVLSNAPAVEEAGSRAEELQRLTTVIIVSILLTSALLVWMFGSKAFWNLWLRLRGGWVLQRVD